MRSIIIEDQAPARNILQKYISNTDSLKLEMTFCDALEAREYLRNHSVDLIFLDINLPRFSGMDFLKAEQNHPLTILTTAYSEFALESYQFNVVDYLLKPFSFERFSQAVEKVKVMRRAVTQIEKNSDVLANQYIYVKCSHDLVRINSDDVIFIKSDSDYTEIVTTSAKFLTSDALRDWTTRLSEDFRQVHKSYIINFRHLKKISRNKVFLQADQVIPLGRAFKKGVMQKVRQTLDT